MLTSYTTYAFARIQIQGSHARSTVNVAVDCQWRRTVVTVITLHYESSNEHITGVVTYLSVTAILIQLLSIKVILKKLVAATV